MNIIVKQEPAELESIDYKHKKFDVKIKRIRYDSNSSTECSSTSTVRPSTNDIATRNNDTPLSIFCDYNNFQSVDQKRNWATFTAETSSQPILKRRRLLKEETNDSGFLMSTQQTDDDDDDDALLIPAPPRFTSTPLSLLATVASATTPFKRRYNHIYESNDSGISMTPHKVEDDAASVASTSTHHSSAYPRYTSTPLAVLAATTSPPQPTPPIAVIMPKISDAAMHSICKYHGNMVRKFPKKERTPKDQERRNKNTIACRMSRRLKKLENVAVEEQYKQFTKQHFEIVEASMRATAYLNALTIKLAAISSGRVSSSSDSSVKLQVKKPKTPVIGRRQPKPFSIEYLTGNSNNS